MKNAIYIKRIILIDIAAEIRNMLDKFFFFLLYMFIDFSRLFKSSTTFNDDGT